MEESVVSFQLISTCLPSNRRASENGGPRHDEDEVSKIHPSWLAPTSSSSPHISVSVLLIHVPPKTQQSAPLHMLICLLAGLSSLTLTLRWQSLREKRTRAGYAPTWSRLPSHLTLENILPSRAQWKWWYFPGKCSLRCVYAKITTSLMARMISISHRNSLQCGN
jgi:hypothetical protein